MFRKIVTSLITNLDEQVFTAQNLHRWKQRKAPTDKSKFGDDKIRSASLNPQIRHGKTHKFAFFEG